VAKGGRATIADRQPRITSVQAARFDKPGVEFTIGGENLSGATAVKFGTKPAAGFSVNGTGTEIKATRPPGPSGPSEITVVTSAGTAPPVSVFVPPDWTQRAIFLVQLLYIFLLVGGLIAYTTWTGFRLGLPDPLSIVPLGVPWSGALGAVTLSMSGLVSHREDWDRAYIYWHLSRPVIGAVLGTFAYLIVAAGVLASGGTPSATTAGAQSVPLASTGPHVNNLFYIVTAFVVGYRESTFRSLLQRVVDALLGPGSGETPATPANGSGNSATTTQ
jgi:hypothetical protein